MNRYDEMRAELIARRGLDPVQAAIEHRLGLALAVEVKKLNVEHEAKGIRSMSKLKALGSHIRDGFSELEQEAEKVVGALAEVKAIGAPVFGKLHEEIAAYKQAVHDAEGVLAQITNGGPPLGNS